MSKLQMFWLGYLYGAITGMAAVGAIVLAVLK